MSEELKPCPLDERGRALVPGLNYPLEAHNVRTLARDLEREVICYGQDDKHAEAASLAILVKRLNLTIELMEKSACR